MSNRWKGGFIQAYFDPLTPGAGSNAIYSWGQNSYGQIGVEDTIEYSSPVQIGNLSEWDKVASGQRHNLSIKTGNTLYAWGQNYSGQLGNGSRVDSSSPVQVGALTNWEQVSAADYSSYAIKVDGTLWSWGTNNSGELGLSDTINRSSPTQVGALTTWAFIHAGKVTAYAIKTDGTLWGWGNNQQYQLGLGYTSNINSPIQIGTDTNWAKVGSFYQGGQAIKTNGTSYVWGTSSNGELGLNVQNDIRGGPTQVGALTTYLDLVSTRGYFRGFINTSNQLWMVGRGDDGQLGINISGYRSSPVQVGSDTNWDKAVGQYQTTFATKTTGTLWSWGNDANGRLGQNTSGSPVLSSPVQIGSETSWANLSASWCFNYVGKCNEWHKLRRRPRITKCLKQSYQVFSFQVFGP